MQVDAQIRDNLISHSLSHPDSILYSKDGRSVKVYSKATFSILRWIGNLTGGFIGIDKNRICDLLKQNFNCEIPINTQITGREVANIAKKQMQTGIERLNTFQSSKSSHQKIIKDLKDYHGLTVEDLARECNLVNQTDTQIYDQLKTLLQTKARESNQKALDMIQRSVATPDDCNSYQQSINRYFRETRISEYDKRDNQHFHEQFLKDYTRDAHISFDTPIPSSAETLEQKLAFVSQQFEVIGLSKKQTFLLTSMLNQCMLLEVAQPFAVCGFASQSKGMSFHVSKSETGLISFVQEIELKIIDPSDSKEYYAKDTRTIYFDPQAIDDPSKIPFKVSMISIQHDIPKEKLKLL